MARPNSFAQQDQGGEQLLQARQLGVVFGVGVFARGKFLFVNVIAGVDPHHLDPAGGFQGGVGLEMDVGHDGGQAAAPAQGGHDVLEIGGVFDRGRGDAGDLAAGGGQFQRLLDAFGGVHGVAGNHRLLHNRMIAADDDAAVCRIAHHHLTGWAAAIKNGRVAIVHVQGAAGLAGFSGCTICVWCPKRLWIKGIRLMS